MSSLAKAQCNLSHPPDVCILSYNSVVNDGRIIKQVESLRRHGYRVEIAGFEQGAEGKRRFLFPEVGLTVFAPASLNVVRAGWLMIWLSTAFFGYFLRADLISLQVNTQSFIVLIALVLSAWIVRRKFKRLKNLFFNLFKSIPSRLSENSLIQRKIAIKIETYFWKKSSAVRQAILEEFAIQSQAKIIHCHDLWTLAAGSRAAAKTGAQLVWDAHELYDHLSLASWSKNAFNNTEISHYQKEVKGFITINESIAKHYHDNFPGLPPAVIVKNATPQIATISYDGRLHDIAKLSLKQKILLYQGGFSEKRGLKSLVQATKFLKNDWTLVLMGWGPLEGDLRSLAEEANFSRNLNQPPAVVFASKAPLNELLYWTAGASVGVIPYENCCLNHLYCTPNKLWEYPAAGVPVLCSPMVELTKTVTTFNMGWLIPQPFKPYTLAETVNQLTNEDLHNAQHGCRKFMDAENWAKYENELVNLYEHLVV